MNVKQFAINKFVSPKSLKHCCIDEFFGTYFLIFFTLLLCWVFTITKLFQSESNALYWTKLSLTFGSCYLFLFVLIFFFGHGGAFFNPALVLAMWSTKRFKTKQTVCYLLVEFIATLFAGLTIYLIAGCYDNNQWVNPTTLGITTVKDNIWVDQITINGVNQAGIGSMFLGFSSELVFFGLFTFAIFEIGKWKQIRKVKQSELSKHTISSLIVSVLLIVIVTIQIPLTGASCNPFRSLAPAIFESWGKDGAVAWIQYPLYLLGTVIGGQIGILCSTHLFRDKKVAPLI
jgi:glycerol uptake facilitator-like aquaporin